MIFAKFVTNDLKSPGSGRFDKIDYSNFGVPLEVEVDTEGLGQCAKGIHVFPVQDNIDFENVIFSSKIILLEVAEEDIIFSNPDRTGKFRARKAIPIRVLEKDDPEMDIIRNAACEDPKWAYWYAINVDKKPSEQTRTAACKSPEYAYLYAVDVDEAPTDQTREAASKDSYYSELYMFLFDKP
jgi:hypothetical protein